MAKEKELEAKKSDAYIAYEAILEAYKNSHPTKYEMKKVELEAKLAKLS